MQAKELFKRAVNWGNYHYYSKPMKVINVKSVQIPIAPSLTELRQNNHVVRIRASHGFLHVISAAELLEKIHETYKKYVPDYERSVESIANDFKITAETLLSVPVQRCTVHKHRNLLAHAPDRLHEEVSSRLQRHHLRQDEARDRGESERPSSANGGSNAAPSPTAWRKRQRSLVHLRARFPKANGNR